jgi:hypothetical protein
MKTPLAFVAAGIVAAMFLRDGPTPGVAAVVQPEPSSVAADAPSIEAFRVLRADTGASCAIAISSDNGAAARLAVEGRCGGVLAALPDARSWAEAADGSVTLATAVVARFAPSEGHAFESFEPKTPILSLTAID